MLLHKSLVGCFPIRCDIKNSFIRSFIAAAYSSWTNSCIVSIAALSACVVTYMHTCGNFSYEMFFISYTPSGSCSISLVITCSRVEALYASIVENS